MNRMVHLTASAVAVEERHGYASDLLPLRPGPRLRQRDRQHACDILDRLSQMAVDSYVSPFDFAIVHAALDDISAALDHLEAACQQRIMRLTELPMPAFDELRPCHRVQAILTAMKLHPPALD